MKELRTEIEIKTSAEKVTQILTKPDAWTEWNPFIHHASGKAQVGEKVDITFRSASKEMTLHSTVVRAKQNKELCWKHHVGLPAFFQGEHSFIIQGAAYAHRDALVRKDRQSQGCIGWRQNRTDKQGKPDLFLGEEDKCEQTPQGDNQGQRQQQQPSRQAGISLSCWMLSVDESANSTSARVTCTNNLLSSGVSGILTQPNPFDPVSAPTARKNIGMVIER